MRVHVHGANVDLSDALKSHIQGSLYQALDRYEDRAERVDVTLENAHGGKHGTEWRCHVVVSIRRREPVVVDHLDGDCYAAIDLAMGRLKRAVRRKINRVRHAHRHQMQRNDAWAQ